MGDEKCRILVVDDEPINIEVIIQCFISTGFQMLAATNGEIACMLAETENLDLIILDWHMPGMSGLEVIEKLRSQESTKNITIIMATGVHTTSGDLEKALKAGAFDYIRKPFDKTELQARVKSAIAYIKSQKEIQRQQQLLFDQKEQQLQDAIELQERELVLRALQIAKQNEMNNKLLDELAELLPETSQQMNASIRNLITKYGLLATNTNWKEFEMRFTQVHHQFYDALQKQFPSLTPNEIKLCAFMRLKMNNTEISAITFQSIDSLRKAKFRLRKKLNLASEAELMDMLASF